MSLLRDGLAHHQSGRLQQAEVIYNDILKDNPRNTDALNFLGVLFHQTGKNEIAISNFEKAIKINPGIADYYNNCGIACRALKKNEKAIIHFEKAIALKPEYAEAHNNLGVVYKDLGRDEDAIACYQQALTIKPDYAEALKNLGIQFHNSGQFEEAIVRFEAFLAISPDDVDVLFNLARVLHKQGNMEEAIVRYNQVLSIKPDYAVAHNNLGAIFQAVGKIEKAVTSFEQALIVNPDYAEAYNNLGNVLHLMGRLQDAIASYERALSIKPDFPAAYINMGNVFNIQGRLEESIICYEHALQLKPDLSQAYQYVGDSLRKLGRVDAAAARYKEFLTIQPEHPAIRIKSALLLPVINSSNETILYYRQKIEQEVKKLCNEKIILDDPYENIGAANFFLAYHGLNDVSLQKKIATLYLNSCPSLSWIAPHCNEFDKPIKNRRIRLGFVSSSLVNHTIGMFTTGIIENINRNIFDVSIFHFGENLKYESIDEISNNVVYLPKKLSVAREMIANHKLDILYYPDIGMDPITYFLSFSRLAPVQCVSWGHPVTTGIPNLDYFISSSLIEPNNAESHYSEQLILLRQLPTYYYQPKASGICKDRKAFGLPVDATLYVCPQSLFKLHPDIDVIWNDLLHLDPKGMIVLINGAQDHWTELLKSRIKEKYPDIVKRIIFISRMDSDDYLKFLNIADALLDPPKFGGGRTTYEAFSQGLPIVTWPGEFMRGRATLGCYKMMGILDLVADSRDSYIKLAFKLANDDKWNKKMQRKIKEKNSVLFESIEAIKELEDFFKAALNAAIFGNKITSLDSLNTH